MKDLDLERIKQGYGLTKSSLEPKIKTDFLKKEKHRMTTLKLIDYQSFISEEARKRYYDAVKDKYEYVCFREVNDIFYLYFYDKEKEN